MKRKNITHLQEIPNIGPATARDLYLLGIAKPAELVGQDPYTMYDKLCDVTKTRHDPCVIDVFISAVRYMEGAPPKKWHHYTKERKKHLSRMGCK